MIWKQISPCKVTNLWVEYSHQKEDKIFAKEEVKYDENWLLTIIKDFQDYWLGARKVAKGVEIEEAWKCGNCDFADNCEWRIAKVQESLNKHKT